jgi:transcriptional regulator of aromatic amino acid metabolism
MDIYKLGVYGILLHKNKNFVPNVQELKRIILHEMHNTPYVGHPGYQKTITIVKSQYFWPGMKRQIAEYISRCMECQKVKIEHRHPTRLL